ncbi:GDSL-type esterase/lipase family protein [Mongoliitalea daihaiensis]|uniref:GDSL-type esterase/lipase family protein n=1 Tax=Mongoliitalea daihaiensis TaxID=2782006 RepID=UPI001F172C73|nr:GDSL-type esterase/lipase family protein [Mongoliitalea daihaiensis]UJP64918.1 G-D-S-L family lipolytic protein [Mongoliitalea daihaiensis]
MQTILKYFFFLSLWGVSFSIAAQDIRFQKEVHALQEKYPPEKFQAASYLFTGSSSIRFWKELTNLPSDQPILNMGFGGSRADDLTRHLEALVIPYQPSKIFIYEGDNDLADGMPSLQIMNEFFGITQRIHTAFPKSTIYILSPKPSISRWHLKAEYEELNNLLKLFTEGQPYLEFIDLWSPLLNPEGEPNPDYFIEDKLHLNEKGYEQWNKVIKLYLQANEDGS